ncbi:MULE and FLYWCH domain containing, partial [Brachionus plicatilis]
MSQKKAPQLHFDGQFYRINGKPNKVGKINWRCIVAKCTGSCSTYGATIGEEVILVSLNDNHSHATDPSKLKNIERRRKIKHKVENSDERPRKILNDLHDEDLNEEEITSAPSTMADKLFINRIKKSIQPNFPPMPSNLSEITFPDFLKITKKEEQFLFYDSGVNDPNRFFIFTTQSNLRNLENAHIFVDGTFDIAPHLFNQIYSIHALALAFIPPEDVIDGFNAAKRKVSNDKVQEFYDYVESTYVGKIETVKRGRGVKYTTVIKEPLFNISLWN